MRRLAFALVAVLCAACTSPTPVPTPTALPTATPTASPTVAPTPIPTATPNPLAPPDQQVLRIYCCYNSDPRSLRPQAASISDEISIIGGIQRGLLYRDGAGNLVPSLAKTLPSLSADGLTYTYTLRDDAQYSDGTPIVATDIVRAARALADPRNAFDLGHLMCYVKGAHELMGTDFGCAEGDTPWLDRSAGTFDDAVVNGLLDQLGVTAPDDHTVVFDLYQRTSFWPDITAMWLLTPVPESQTSWMEAEDIISSGPFMIDSWRHNSEIDLVPNPLWYGLRPTLLRIEIHMTGDPAAAVTAWERGDLDEVRVPSSEVGRVLATPNYASMIFRSSTLSVEYHDFANCQAEDQFGKTLCPPNDAVTEGIVGGSPTQNVHFRQALTQAIDKTDLVNVTFAGIGVPAYSPTMPGIPGGFPTITAENSPTKFDPAAALANLNTALRELGVAEPDPASVPAGTDDCDADCQQTKAWAKMLGPMRFGYNCDAGHDSRVLYMADQWQQVLGFTGDQFDTRCTDNGLFPGEPRHFGNVYDVERNGWAADFPHPDNQNRDLFACGVRNNSSKYCTPAYDELLDRGAQAASYADSLPFYHQAEETLVADAPVLFLRYGESVSLIRPWVINHIQTPSDHQNVGDVFYENIRIAAH